MSTSILSNEFLAKYINTHPAWGFNGLGYIVYKRTYARWLPELNRTEEWWETVARCVNGAQKIGAGYTQEEAERLYDHVFNLRCNFAGRMLWQLGTETVDKIGLPSLCNCFSYDTEILTEQGIASIGDLSGSTVSVMTENGVWKEAEIKDFGKQELVKLTLTKGKSRKTVHTTKNHRWFRWARRGGSERILGTKRIECLTVDLEPGDKLVSVFGQSVKNIVAPSKFGIAHGIVFGDGSINYNRSCIRLCGEKNHALLQYFNNSPTSNCDGDILVTNLPSFFKDRPSLTLEKGYLYGWLAGYFAADGSVKECGQIRLSSANIDNLKFVRDVCVKLGINYTTISYQDRIGIGQDQPSKLFSIGLNGADLTEDFFLIAEHRKRFVSHQYENRSDWKVESVEHTGRVENVYCAIVPDTHSFALEGNILTGNCWFVNLDSPEAFCFIFEHLMLGGGVGYSVKKEHVHELPKIKEGVVIKHIATKDADFIVPDSREGWVELLRRVLQAYFVTGKGFTYSTILVRGAGERINGFGGTASGPQILIDGLTHIFDVLNKRAGKKLRSIDALDVANILGSIVVAGNVRRSAQIAIGDADDKLFLNAKRWDLGNIPNWRAMSNNTVNADTFDYLSNDFWQGYNGKGEPYGLANIDLCRKFGRLIDGPMSKSSRYPQKEDKVDGLNPCAEATLQHGEPCDLAEIYLHNITSIEQFKDCARLLYKSQKAILRLPSISQWTNDVVKKNMRIGLGVTGVCEDISKVKWLDEGYISLREFDKEWSAVQGWPESIKLTVIKPSGTLSLLAGCTPGGHPAYDRYYLRRVRMSSNDSLVNICRGLGCHVEYQIGFDGKEQHDTVVVEFPCRSSDNAILAKDMSAIQQLELLKTLQTYWADQAVSITVYYRKEELPAIKDWLKENYETGVKSVSFLLHSDHGFKQAPYESIDQNRYEELLKKIKPLSSLFVENEVVGGMESVECANGVCPVR